MQVIFEDEDVLIVDKGAGEIVHPASGEHNFVISNELKKIYPEICNVGSVERPGVVHRLDKDTSGVMVFARNKESYRALRRDFESHATVEKTYLAVCHGSPSPSKGTIETPIGRQQLSAITHWNVLARRSGVSLIEFKIETGRMHQIRIHAAELGSPIVGDPLYGSKVRDRSLSCRPKRTLLHSTVLSFIHPSNRVRVEFTAPPPNDIVYAVS